MCIFSIAITNITFQLWNGEMGSEMSYFFIFGNETFIGVFFSSLLISMFVEWDNWRKFNDCFGLHEYHASHHINSAEHEQLH